MGRIYKVSKKFGVSYVVLFKTSDDRFFGGFFFQKMITYCVLVLGVVTLTWGQIITQWTVDQFPNPMKNPEKCGGEKGRPSFLCDPNSILPTSCKCKGHEPKPSFVLKCSIK